MEGESSQLVEAQNRFDNERNNNHKNKKNEKNEEKGKNTNEDKYLIVTKNEIERKSVISSNARTELLHMAFSTAQGIHDAVRTF